MDTGITRIETYTNDLLSLLADYEPETYSELTERQREIIDHLCDYEDLTFIVINEETVITADDLNGHVIAEDNIDDFTRELLNQIDRED